MSVVVHVIVFGVTYSRYSATVHVFDGTLVICLWHGEGRVGWGGVGWGGLITFKYTSTHTSCYATARLSCTCTHTHTSCYATARFPCTCTHRSCNVGVGWGGGANNVQVYFYTQVMLRYCTFLLHLHTHFMLRCGNTYTSSSTDITIKTRNPSCSG